MGQITSGIGLISGLNIKDIVDQLMAIEARPKNMVESRNVVLQSQQVAYQEISAKMLAIDSSMNKLTQSSAFSPTSSTSSDSNVLTVSSNSKAAPGTYAFTVDRLVSSQQAITRGFADMDVSAVGTGTLTFEVGGGKLTRDTRVEELNGGDGIARGKISIGDRAGNTAVVDLTKVLTVEDVLEQINNTAGINVRATVEGDSIVINDESGSTSTALTVSNVGAGTTATDLGLNVAAVGDKLTGNVVRTAGLNTAVTNLNDGLGVRFSSTSADDIRITHALGTFNVNLTGSNTLEDIITKINDASAGAGAAVTASINDDQTGLKVDGATLIENVGSSLAADDLKLTTLDGSYNGGRLVSSLNSVMLENLNGGSGVTTMGSIEITNRDGTTKTIDLSSAHSVSDIVKLINDETDADPTFKIAASLNNSGNGIQITDSTGSATSDLIIADVGGSTVAADLGLDGSFAATSTDSGNLQHRYIGEATTLASLNGGLGVDRGKFQITDSTGSSATVDLTQGDELTVGDVIDEINSRGLSINARINDSGDGILIEDTAAVGDQVYAIKVSELGSTTASDLGLLGEAEAVGDDFNGSFEKTVGVGGITTMVGTTQLSELNGGDGVSNKAGLTDFRIHTASGVDYYINLDGLTTVDDLITEVGNTTGGDVTLAIAASGKGFQLTDNTTGSDTFELEARNNSAALEDLGLADAEESGGVISGEQVVEILTLEKLAQKINNADVPVRATVINDGSGANSYRLSLQSRTAGEAGAFVFDDGGLGLEATTLVEAENALLFYGGTAAGGGIPITSTSNTLTNVVPNATITLKSTSSSPVTVNISRDDAAIVSDVQGMVDAVNEVLDTFDKYDSYDQETEERGLLLGDGTILNLRNVVRRLFNNVNGDLTGRYNAMYQVGVKFGEGARLVFDESKFRSALETDFDAVQQLFTYKETETDPVTEETVTTKKGIGVAILEAVQGLTDSLDGTIQRKIDSLDTQIQNNEKRIEDMNDLLELKRQRMEAEFYAMERALADLQASSNALASLPAVTGITQTAASTQ